MAAKGYTTELLVEAELGITIDATTTPTSTQVATWIEEIESLIDSKTESSFTSVTVTNEIMELHEHNGWRSPMSIRNNTFGPGSILVDLVRLPYYPIVSMTSLSVNNASDSGSDDWTDLTENTGSGGNYTLQDKGSTGFVQFIDQFPKFQVRSLKFTLNYGYSSIPGVVQMLATKMVARRTIDMKMKKSQAGSIDSIELKGISIRKNATQTTQVLAALDNEIRELWTEVGAFVSELAG